MLRRRVNHVTSLEERIAERVKAIKARADAFPPGSKERERMERRAAQASTGSAINAWLMSPGLRLPEQFQLATNSYGYREEKYVGPSNTLSRNLATGGGEPVQHGSSEQHKAAEIDLMRKNASEIYDIVFSADRTENSERKNDPGSAALDRRGR